MIDCSDNLDLFWAWNEKSQYYFLISVSVNSAVFYHQNQVQSFGKIIDLDSHKADAAWESV